MFNIGRGTEIQFTIPQRTKYHVVVFQITGLFESSIYLYWFPHEVAPRPIHDKWSLGWCTHGAQWLTRLVNLNDSLDPLSSWRNKRIHIIHWMTYYASSSLTYTHGDRPNYQQWDQNPISVKTLLKGHCEQTGRRNYPFRSKVIDWKFTIDLRWRFSDTQLQEWTKLK